MQWWGKTRWMIGTTLLCACSTSSNLSSADLGKSTVQVSPASLPATGSDVATVLVVLKRGNGSPLPGLRVHLIADGCIVTQPAAPTDARGETHGFVASTQVGPHSITASVASGELTSVLTMSATI